MVDWVLFARILIVYPYHSTPRLKFVAIISFPIAMKLARAGVLLAFCRPWAVTAGYESLLATNRFARVEWFLAMFDNGQVHAICCLLLRAADALISYASILFLRKLRFGFKNPDSGRLTSGTIGMDASPVSAMCLIGCLVRLSRLPIACLVLDCGHELRVPL
jgi:hypothetical protein